MGVPTQPTKVLLPMIRRVMPQLIAQSIIGIQPMDNSVGSIFALTRSKYSRVPLLMNNDLYRYFLRLNNRKKFQTGKSLYKAGYTSVDISHLTATECEVWCSNQFKKHSWLRDRNILWFSREQDVTLFKLVWCEDLLNE